MAHTGHEKIKYLLVTDIPAPWREKVYENVHRKLGDAFHVAYCSHNEKRRLWTFPHGNHSKTIMKSLSIGNDDWERFVNPEIIPMLLREKPEIVICFSLNPTVIMAYLISKLMHSKTIVFADTWLGRDEGINWIQRTVRKFIYNCFGDAFIGASRQTLLMYKHYNNRAKDESLFLSALCADNEYYERALTNTHVEKKYDLLFSGRIVELKNPLFIVDVAEKVKAKRGRCSVLIMGDGDRSMKEGMFGKFEKADIQYEYAGFVKHSKLPEFYSQARILLLPTSRDCWGVVINEAMISGLPVITTDRTAAAGELVIDGKNGYVLPLDAELWADKIADLLENRDRLETFAENARETVREFNFAKAAEGIIAAIRYAESRK